MFKIKDVWGETIKRIVVLFVLAVAAVAIPAMAQGIAGEGKVDILGNGIFETEGSAFKFMPDQDTNFDNVVVGNDVARAFGMDPFPFGQKVPANAQNNLEIKKNQESGVCKCCYEHPMIRDDEQAEAMDYGCHKPICENCCKNANIEQIKVGNREATAFGFASAVNNVKIVTNQMGPTGK